MADSWIRGLAEQLAPDVERRPWREWLAAHFAAYTTAPFAERHVRFWEWIDSLRPGIKPPPRVEVWPRGGAKSTTVELGCTFIGSAPRPVRRFVLYVSETQAQADAHIQAIATNLETVGIKRAVNEYGASKGWRRAQIRAANGFNAMAFGLDSGMRGIKLDDARPDLIVMDDIDGRHDTEATIQKKIDVLTETILPAGSTDAAVIIVQNKIHKDSIVSRLCDGRADFLHDREPPTVEPAVEGLQYAQEIRPDGRVRYRITAGTPTWAGQDLATCERQLNEWGVGAFLREAQHEVAEVEGGLWQRERDIAPFRVTTVPELDLIAVAVDPNQTGTGDAAGIVVAGVSRYLYDRGLGAFVPADRLHGYVLDDRTVAGGPHAWSEAAVAAYHAYQADRLVAEANNGGEMVAITIGTIPGAPAVELVHASRGKRTRAEPVQKLYAQGRVHHVGTFVELEKEMCTWVPAAGKPSPNRMDALVWALTALLLGGADMSEVAEAWAEEME